MNFFYDYVWYIFPLALTNTISLLTLLSNDFRPNLTSNLLLNLNLSFVCYFDFVLFDSTYFLKSMKTKCLHCLIICDIFFLPFFCPFCQGNDFMLTFAQIRWSIFLKCTFTAHYERFKKKGRKKEKY